MSVNEDAPLGTSVGTLSVTDPEGDPLMFQITSGDIDGAFFVDSNGELVVNNMLDFEVTQSYQLTVEASDGLSNTYATINVTVNDVAEAPVFDPDTYSVTVREDATGAILQLLATDPQGDILTYTITGGDPNYDFYIDFDGQLTVCGGLDYETTTSYQLTVEVSDGTETDTATVNITVTDVFENVAPVITSFIAADNGGNSWTFSGTVDDEAPEYMYIDFGGIIAGYHIAVNNDGTFAMTIDLPPGTEGIATAITTDILGLTSNTAQDWVFPI